MTSEDKRWSARVQQLLAPLWSVVQPPGGRLRVAPLKVYCGLMRAHRWLWIRGIEV